MRGLAYASLPKAEEKVFIGTRAEKSAADLRE
jgi:hypothetical protein